MATAVRCFNCGSKPTIRLVTEADQEPDYSHVLVHAAPLCPFGLQSWQSSRQDCISDWNRHNQCLLSRKI